MTEQNYLTIRLKLPCRHHTRRTQHTTHQQNTNGKNMHQQSFPRAPRTFYAISHAHFRYAQLRYIYTHSAIVTEASCIRQCRTRRRLQHTLRYDTSLSLEMPAPELPAEIKLLQRHGLLYGNLRRIGFLFHETSLYIYVCMYVCGVYGWGGRVRNYGEMVS